MSEQQSFADITAGMSDADLSAALDRIDPPVERPSVEPGTFASDKVGLEEAASEVSQTRGERNQVTERVWGDAEKGWMERAPDSVEIDAKEAADGLKATREFEQKFSQEQMDAELQRQVDNFRAGEQPQQQPEQLQTQPEHAPQPETELDRLLQPLPAEHRQPFVQGYNELLQRTQHEAQQHYAAAQAQYTQVLQQSQAALAQTIAVAEGLALAPFSELHGVPANELPAIVNQLQRQNPQRYAQLAQHVAVVRDLAGKQLQQAAAAQQQQAQKQKDEQFLKQYEFDQWGAAEDAKIDKLLNAETSVARAEIKNEVFEILREDGWGTETLAHHWATNPVLRSATAQRLLMNEAKSRIAARNIRAARQTPVPQVQKPGASVEGPSDRSEYADLSRQYRGKDLSVKDATKLLLARRASR
jgi:hypothetical protein